MSVGKIGLLEHGGQSHSEVTSASTPPVFVIPATTCDAGTRGGQGFWVTLTPKEHGEPTPLDRFLAFVLES